MCQLSEPGHITSYCEDQQRRLRSHRTVPTIRITVATMSTITELELHLLRDLNVTRTRELLTIVDKLIGDAFTAGFIDARSEQPADISGPRHLHNCLTEYRKQLYARHIK